MATRISRQRVRMLLFAAIQSFITSGVASGVSSARAASTQFLNHWVTSWLLAWMMMLPIVLTIAPVLQWVVDRIAPPLPASAVPLSTQRRDR